jgi:hypothetical protein
MKRVPVKGYTYRNKWGTQVTHRPSFRRVPGGGGGEGSTRPPSPNSVRPVNDTPATPVKKRRTTVTVIVVATVAVTVAIAVGTAAAVSSSAGGTPVSQADVQTINASNSTTAFKNKWAGFLASGYRHVGFAIESDSNCQQHSYGLVKGFFTSHPCEWVTRAYMAIHYGNVGEVLVALSWVGMPDSSLAAEYKSLVDKGGTGNITELSHDTGPYKSVQYNGQFYTSGLDGSSAWNVELQPVGLIPSGFISGIFDEFK